ncbi:MAG TPA: TetR/AcrR family transcriptional regulator [Desulfuromonadales bacterium]|jgi:AcrR family transcriptional regulator
MTSEKIDKRAALLEAALELFAENGFHGAPTSLIAERAGVGVGTIYRYFKDKDELIRELHQELHVKAVAWVCDDYREDQPVRERFIFLMTRLLRLFLSEPKVFRFMEQYYYSPFPQSCGYSAPGEEEVIKRLLLFARDQQIIKDAPLPVLEAIAFGPIVALAKEYGIRQLVVDEAMIRIVVEACWDGLKR